MANRYPLIVDSSSQQIKEFPSGDTLVIDNLQVTGTTTTLETATLNVEDKNITINYSSGDSSGTADGSGLTFQDAVDASTDATILWDTTNDRFQFSHGAEVTSGNLLVGTTDTAVWNNSTGEGVVIQENAIQIARSGNVPLLVNRQTDDGEIARLLQGGSTVGSISAKGGDLTIGTGDTGLRFTDGDDAIWAIDTSTGNGRDNAVSLGVAGARFKDLYLSGVAKIDSSAYISQQAITSSSNSVAWNAATQANAYHLLTENTTFAAPSNAVEGAIISVEIAQGGTPYTVAWNTVFEFAASTAPTMTATANKTDIFSFRYNGSVWQEIGRVQNMAQT